MMLAVVNVCVTIQGLVWNDGVLLLKSLAEKETCIAELDVHIIIRECCRQILCQKLETFIARN